MGREVEKAEDDLVLFVAFDTRFCKVTRTTLQNFCVILGSSFVKVEIEKELFRVGWGTLRGSRGWSRAGLWVLL